MDEEKRGVASSEGNPDDQTDIGEQRRDDGGSPKAAEAPAKEEAPKESPKSDKKKLRFALADNQLMWSTPNKSIELSAFTQVTGGEIDVDKDDSDYQRVKRAINLEVLIELKPNQEFPKFKGKDISYGKVQEDEAAKARKTFNVKEYLDMRQEEVVDKIKEIDDPKVVIRLIQAEKKGENHEKVMRQNVISALREKLKHLNINGVYDIELDDL